MLFLLLLSSSCAGWPGTGLLGAAPDQLQAVCGAQEKASGGPVARNEAGRTLGTMSARW